MSDFDGLTPTYTFRLQIERSDRTILNTAINAKATADDIAKAKKSIRRLLDEYTPAIKTTVTLRPGTVLELTPEPDLPAPPENMTDLDLENLWLELADVPFDDNDPDVDMTLAENWKWFRKGTPREEIWRWFDERHSKGVAFLLYGAQDPEPQGAPEEALAPAGGGHISDKRPEGARGLLRLYCQECGNTFGTFLKERQSEITCRCGHHIDLTAPLARYRFTCPYCEKEAWGQTNLEDPEITIRCKCGGNVDLRWVPKAKEYQN